jgi:hypothetical protein
MATVKGINKTKIDTPGAADRRLEPGLFDGRVKVMKDEYEASALAIGSIIEMGQELPTGAKIIDVILHTDNLGNNTTLIVGDYEDDNRYITATDHGAGAELVTRLNAIAGRMYEVDDTTPGATTTDKQIIVTTAAGIATGTISLIILYSHD